MIQCKDCEYFEMDNTGRRTFKCDPFLNVKEPECISKWQLLRLDMLLASHQGMMQWQSKMGPLQNKIIKFMERQIDEMDESDSWKQENEEPEDENNWKIE